MNFKYSCNKTEYDNAALRIINNTDIVKIDLTSPNFLSITDVNREGIIKTKIPEDVWIKETVLSVSMPKPPTSVLDLQSNENTNLKANWQKPINEYINTVVKNIESFKKLKDLVEVAFSGLGFTRNTSANTNDITDNKALNKYYTIQSIIKYG